MRKSEVDLGFLKVRSKEGIEGAGIYSCATGEASEVGERQREKVRFIGRKEGIETEDIYDFAT